MIMKEEENLPTIVDRQVKRRLSEILNHEAVGQEEKTV